MPPATSASSYNKALVGWLSVAQLIGWGSVFYLFAQIMAPVEQALGLSRPQSSLAFSLCLLTDGLLAFPIGRLIDRGYERLVMTTGSLLLAAGLALHSNVHNLWAFYAVWVLLGAGMAGSLYAPVFAVVTRRFPGDFRRAIITMTFLGGLASTVFIPLTAWLIATLGWREALLALAALNLLVCAPLHYFWLQHAPKTETDPQHQDSPTIVVDDENATAPAVAEQRPAAQSPQATPTTPLPESSLAQHLQSAPFLLIGLSILCMAVATSALPSHMITLLREYGMGESWVIIVPASIGALQVVGRLSLYFFEHRFDVHAANRFIPCLMPLGLVFLLLAPLVALPHSGLMLLFLLFFVCSWGIGNGMLTIVKGTAMAQYVSRLHVASLNGALGVPLALVRAAAPLWLGLMWNTQTGYRNGIVLMVAAAAVGALALAQAQRLALRGPAQGGEA